MVANFPSRLLHDLGLAAWFGGTLANAVALNRAAGQVSDPSSAGRVVNSGWDAWTPINAVAIGAPSWVRSASFWATRNGWRLNLASPRCR